MILPVLSGGEVLVGPHAINQALPGRGRGHARGDDVSAPGDVQLQKFNIIVDLPT